MGPGSERTDGEVLIVMWPADETDAKSLIERKASDGLWAPASRQAESESEIDIGEDATVRLHGGQCDGTADRVVPMGR